MNERSRFDKFSDGARQALRLAQEEAQRFQHDSIDTENLLLGLLCEGEGVASNVLNSPDVERYKVRDAVEFLLAMGLAWYMRRLARFHARKKVIELVVGQAHRLKHHAIGTENLLFGLVREGNGLDVGILEGMGVSLERVRTETMKMLKQQKTS
jgi:ATP-dependent Clp protease ATP-binding subunit ClpC